jgi:RHS repeat-associated protein
MNTSVIKQSWPCGLKNRPKSKTGRARPVGYQISQVAPLRDALGNTIAIVDSNGVVRTSYTYEPFGNTSVTGTTNTNEFQYTGRENESNGLYFYRARYYSPLLGRFISEDPIGFGGGLNLYSYVFDSPTNLTDASGNCPTCIDPGIAPVAVGTGAVAGAGVAIGVGETSAPVFIFIAEGTAAGSRAGPAGALAGAGLAGMGGIFYTSAQATSAVMDENAAYADYFQAEHQLNLILLQKKVQQLSGRYNNNDDEEDCEEMYRLDREVCKKLPTSKRPACYDQAMQRYAACLPPRGPIPPFPWRRPQ